MQAMCRDYYVLQFIDRSVDTAPIAPALAAFFDDVLDQSISQLNFKVSAHSWTDLEYLSSVLAHASLQGWHTPPGIGDVSPPSHILLPPPFPVFIDRTSVPVQPLMDQPPRCDVMHCCIITLMRVHHPARKRGPFVSLCKQQSKLPENEQRQYEILQAIVDGLGAVLFNYPFRVPAYYALILRSLTVLEGLALSADRNYKLLAKAYPYMAKRLLTDPSPELR